METAAEEKKVYKARCHCGNVRFTVAIPPLETGAMKPNRCNCSICTKNGNLHVYPLRTDVHFLRGEEKLKEYRFANKDIPHLFCDTCRTSILAELQDCSFSEESRKRLAVTIRTFDNIDEILDKPEYTSFDGKNKIGMPYKVDD